MFETHASREAVAHDSKLSKRTIPISESNLKPEAALDPILLLVELVTFLSNKLTSILPFHGDITK